MCEWIEVVDFLIESCISLSRSLKVLMKDWNRTSFQTASWRKQSTFLQSSSLGIFSKLVMVVFYECYLANNSTLLRNSTPQSKETCLFKLSFMAACRSIGASLVIRPSEVKRSRGLPLAVNQSSILYCLKNKSLNQSFLLITYSYTNRTPVKPRLSTFLHPRHNNFIMNRCQHGQKITKFCVTEHCHHKEAAGCDYCIRKYHFHLTNTQLLSEDQVNSLIRNLTLPTDIKFKARHLQQAAIEYLKQIKYNLNSWLEQAQSAISDRLTNTILYKQGLLSTFNRLKQKEYRKVNARELRLMDQYAKNVSFESLKNQETSSYYDEVEWTMKVLASAEKMAQQMLKLPELRQSQKFNQQPYRTKINQIYETIKQEKDKKQIQINIIATSNSTNHQLLSLIQNPNLKQVESYENVDAFTLQFKSKSKEALEKKAQNIINQEGHKKSNQLTPQQSYKATVVNETVQQKRQRIRNRRSSIDDKIDLKFAAMIEEKAKFARQAEEAKKKLQEKLDQKSQQIKPEESRPIRPMEQNQVQQRQKRLSQDAVNSNTTPKRQEVRKQQEVIPKVPKKMTVATPSQDKSKSDLSSNKASESNFYGALDILIDNILPPLPPTPKSHTQEPIFQKVIKIPVSSHGTDEILSPIYKSRKKQQDKKSGVSRLGLVLIPPVDKIEEKLDKLETKEIQTLFPIPQDPPQEEGSVDAIAKKNSASDQKQDDLIHLQRDQKNSLLLFSQALKSPGDRAIQLLKAALKYSAQNLSAAEYLSYLYVEGEKAKQCLQVCQNVLVHIKDSPQEFDLTLHLHNNKAAALNLLGRYSESIMVLEKCLRYRKKHYFFKNLGDAYFNLGITEKAAMNYQKAVELDPQYDQAFYNLSVTKFIQQEYVTAKLSVLRALNLQPTNESYLQLLKEIEIRIQNSTDQ